MKFRLGDATRNALLNGAARQAAYRQTQLQHDRYANKYVRPGMSPMEIMLAQARGEQEERLNPRYWDDQEPRRPLNPSSSWIDEIEYLPDMGLAIMHTGGREYYYPMTARQVGNWVTAPSIGSWYNRNIKLK